jgi:hypothetical protein
MLNPRMIEAFKAHWPTLLLAYAVMLLTTLYFGLRHRHKGTKFR